MVRGNAANRLFLGATQSIAYATGREPIVKSSGDKLFDAALAVTLSRLSDALGVLPGFAFYDDYEGANAFATPAVRLKNADGTVLFGTRYLKRLLSLPEHPEIAVAAVCAHEFGHILQFQRGLDDVVNAGQTTVRRSELQADYFAGYFAGLRKLERADYPAAVYALTQFNAGDDMVNHPDHHGTNDERGAAISKGFEAAFRSKLSLGDAITASTSYVSAI